MTPEDAHKPVKEDIRNPVSYKLGHYEITEKNAGRLFWKTYRGKTVAKTGRCNINGNILFLGPAETVMSSPLKRAPMQKSACLPDWEKTGYYCRIYAIHYSNSGGICRKSNGDKDLQGHAPDIDTGRNKGRNVGKKIESIVRNKTPIKNIFATVLNLCSLTVCLVVKLLLKFFHLTLEITKALIARGRRIRG